MSSTDAPVGNDEGFDDPVPAMGSSPLVSLLDRRTDSPVTPDRSAGCHARGGGENVQREPDLSADASQAQWHDGAISVSPAQHSSPPRQFLTRGRTPRSCSQSSAEHTGPRFSSPPRPPASNRGSHALTASSQFRSPAQSLRTGVSESPTVRMGSPAAPARLRQRELSIRLISTERSRCEAEVEVCTICWQACRQRASKASNFALCTFSSSRQRQINPLRLEDIRRCTCSCTAQVRATKWRGRTLSGRMGVRLSSAARSPSTTSEPSNR